MKRTLLPLLIISPLAMAEPQVEAPMPPAMITIPVPEIPNRSLEEELNREAKAAAEQRKYGYTLDAQGGRGYLEPKQDDANEEMMTPQWELFRWEGSSGQQR